MTEEENITLPKAYKDKTQLLLKTVAGELCCTVLMIFTLYLMLIGPLWDKVYVDTIKKDWNTSPLIAVYEKTKGEDCDSGDEIITKAYWWGLKAGCSCKGGTYAAAKREVCTDEELADYCYNTLKRPA